jgi:hypothetical protein
LKIDSVLVRTFQQHLMRFIENTFELPPRKTVSFSDKSSAVQYKNRKKILNTTCHSEEFASNILWEECLVAPRNDWQQKPVFSNHKMGNTSLAA